MTENENNTGLTPAEEPTKVEETPKAAPPAAEAPEKKPAAEKQKMCKKTKSMIGIIVAVIAIAVLVVLIIADGAKTRKAAAEAEALAAAEAEAAEAEAAAAAAAESAESAPAVPTLDLDFDAAYAKYAPDTVVYTLNGTPVPWSDYYCWIYSVIGQLTNYYGITDWTMVLDESSGLTVLDYILDYAEGVGGQYTLIHSKAAELGITLDDADLAKIDALTQSDADAYYGGDREALAAYLSENYYTGEYYDYMNASPVLYDKIFAHFYGEDASKLADSDVMSFLNEHGYLHAKHILLKTVDESNEPLDEVTVAAKKAQAEDLLAQLKTMPAEDLNDKFDEMIKEFGEDPGALSHPDGYYFQSGEMVAEFEAAAKALAVGEISDIVESAYGYHILYNPAVDPGDLFDYDDSGAAVSLRKAVANGLFSNTASGWLNEAEIVYTPEFESFDLFKLFDIA